MTAPWWWLLVLGGTALGLVAFYAVMPWLVQPVVRSFFFLRYTLKVRGKENVPRTGPVLFVVNHLTWIDGFFLVSASPRPIWVLGNAELVNRPGIRHLLPRVRIIPVPYKGPHAVRATIQTARTVLDRGGALTIFPEAQLSRTGLTGPFYRGLEVILSGREQVVVVPVFLDNLWGSLLSNSGGRFFRKWPEGLRRTVVVVFGEPLRPPITAFEARQAVLATGVRAFALRPRSRPLETIDPALPHFDHPELGRLTASTANFDRGGIRQVGHKPGTVGQAVPGVALRIVDDAGEPLGPDTDGRLQALLPGRPDWVDTGYRGRLDADGFLRLLNP